MTDREQLCKEFTLLTNGHWYEWPKECGGSYTYIEGEKSTYKNPADILKVMIGRKDWLLFKTKCLINTDNTISMILEQDAILKEAIKFLKERKND